MIQIFYKDKPIIISDKKSDLKDTLLIDLKIIKSVDILKLLRKKKVFSIGIKSKSPEKVISKFSKLFPEIIAAGGKVYNDKSEILFIYRNKKWDLPKGRIEKNEAIKTAAIREVEEETGAEDLEIIKPLTQTFHIFTRHGKYKLKKTYWFEMKTASTKKLTPQANEGIEEAVWVSESEVPSKFKNAYENIKQVYAEFKN